MSQATHGLAAKLAETTPEAMSGEKTSTSMEGCVWWLTVIVPASQEVEAGGPQV